MQIFFHVDNEHWSDCTDAQTDLSLRWTPMSEGTSSHIAAYIVINLSRRQIGLIQQTTNWWCFSDFCKKTGFDISCKLSPLETICMKCQILFPEKNKKNISQCLILKILLRVLSSNKIYEIVRTVWFLVQISWRQAFLYYAQLNFNNLNTDDSLTLVDTNLFLGPWELLAIAQENK